MQGRLGHLAPGLEFVVGDALRMNFSSSSFDVVMEKGTLEALGSDRTCLLVDPGCEMLAVEKKVLLEAFRVLRPGGILISVADDIKPFDELWKQGLSDWTTDEIRPMLVYTGQDRVPMVE